MQHHDGTDVGPPAAYNGSSIPLGGPGGGSDPALLEFLSQVDTRFKMNDLGSFWGMEDAFRALVESGFATRFINHELAQMVAQPSYLGNWRPSQIVIHRGSGFALSIWFLEHSRKYIHTTSFLGMYSPVGKASLYYDVYRLPANYKNSVFDPAVQLIPDGVGITGQGGILLLQSEDHVYNFHAERPLPVLSFVTASFQTMEWLFNKDNLYAWNANDAERSCTQLRVASYVLGRLSYPSSLEALETLVDHGHHSVRWAAMENMGRISRRAALECITRATTDPHPHVRRAAAATLRLSAPPK
ncbi:MAG: repeat protein [Nevskia sp.]|nr:repeat protein [Nevskia sp.]